jgi:hypothetical protein
VKDSATGSCPKYIYRTYKAVDDCGNTSYCTQKITVDDKTPPYIKCPADITVSCIGDVPDPDVTKVTASDNCGKVTVTFVKDSATGSCPKYIYRTYKAADDCGNTSYCTQKITVDDKTPPYIKCPADITVSCIVDVPDPDVTKVTASDNCGKVTVTFVKDSSTGSCPKYIYRTYKAADDCGNTSYCTQKITVDDKIPPYINCPADITVSCIGDVPDPDVTKVTASDNCGKVTVTFVKDSSTGSCPKYIYRTYKAADDCGNTSYCTQKITVDDKTPPYIKCPDSVTVSCIGDVPAPDVTKVTASDNCGKVTVTFVKDVDDYKTCPKTITRTYKAADECGNYSMCTQIITVWDKTPPVIKCPYDITVGSCKNKVTYTVTATDNCGGTPTIVTVPASGTVFPVGTTTVTSTATDACGNKTTCSFKVIVKPAPTCKLTVPSTKPTCGSVGNKLCATVTGVAPLTYQWTVTGTGWLITGGQGTSCITYTAGSLGISATFKLKITDKYGCTCSCTVTFGCVGEGCTPGFWKNAPTFWDQPTDPVSSCVAAAIAAKGAPYSGNGTTTSLFRTTFGLSSADMTAMGLNNNLTLIKAIGLGGGGYQKLARHATAALLSTCGLTQYPYTTAQVLTMTHDAIIARAAEPTASNLAKANEGNCTLSSDGNGGYVITMSSVSTPPAGTQTLIVPGVGDKPTIKAYPNPYLSTINFQFVSPVKGKALLEAYDLLGKRIAIVFEGNVDAYSQRTIQYNVPEGNRVPIMYKLTIGDYKLHGIMLPTR